MSDGIALIINEAGLEAGSTAAGERRSGHRLYSCDAGAGASMPSSVPASATPAGERLKPAEMEELLHEQAAQIRALMARLDEQVGPYDPDGAALRRQSSKEKVVEGKAVVTQGFLPRNPFADFRMVPTSRWSRLVSPSLPRNLTTKRMANCFAACRKASTLSVWLWFWF